MYASVFLYGYIPTAIDYTAAIIFQTGFEWRLVTAKNI